MRDIHYVTHHIGQLTTLIFCSLFFILYRLKITNDMGMRYYMYYVQSMNCMNTKTANFHFQKNH